MILLTANLACPASRRQPSGSVPGTAQKFSRPAAGSLEGIWYGGDWGELTITVVGRDSIVGRVRSDVVVHGTVAGNRADVTVTERESRRSGYLFTRSSGDSLYIGLRDSVGAWERFFAMGRRSSPPTREGHP